MRFSTIASIVLAMAVFPVSAEVYKWKTESGEIQYGQFPPAGVKAERMTASGLQSVPEPEAADDTATGSDAAEPAAQQSEEVTGEQQHGNAQQQANAAQQEAERKQQCAAARSDLTVLQQGGHRRMRLPDGTVTRLTPEETEQRITTAKEFIEKNCS
jgi:hypothetical protein